MSELQHTRRLAFLGPEGTFTHTAARDLARPNEQLVAMQRAEQVIVAAESGDSEGPIDGVIAFETSLEGPVTANLDLLLATESSLLITGERILQIDFSLWRRADDTSPLIGVIAHEFGLSQCSNFIDSNGLQKRSADSNGAACELVADANEIPNGWAALAGPEAGKAFGLSRTQSSLQNDPRASTRFLRLGHHCDAATGHDRTAFVLMPDHDSSGSLVELLSEFSSRGINLTALKSRPRKELLGDYSFFVEFEGHIQDPMIQQATLGLLRSGTRIRFLGSYAEDIARCSDVHKTNSVETKPLKSLQLQLAEMLSLTAHGSQQASWDGPRVGICGLGLIGGSIALALSEKALALNTFDLNPEAQKWAASFGHTNCKSVTDLAEQCDVVLLCTPPAVTAEIAIELLRANPSLVLADTSSVKSKIVNKIADQAIADRTGNDLEATNSLLRRFVPVHPMTGSEHSGFEFASSAIVTDATWAVSPPLSTSDNDLESLHKVLTVLELLLAKIVFCTVESHDQAVALSSHAPHLIAGSLASVATSDGHIEAQTNALPVLLSGGSLRDGTRVALAPTELWSEILEQNSQQVESALNKIIDQIETAKSSLKSSEQIKALWQKQQASAKQIRQLRWSEPSWQQIEVAATWPELLQLARAGLMVRQLKPSASRSNEKLIVTVSQADDSLTRGQNGSV